MLKSKKYLIDWDMKTHDKLFTISLRYGWILIGWNFILELQKCMFDISFKNEGTSTCLVEKPVNFFLMNEIAKRTARQAKNAAALIIGLLI